MTRKLHATDTILVSLAAALILFLVGVLPLAAQEVLPSWNDTAAKSRITAFVKATVTEGGEGYVAPQDRIAVFDNDGTLWCEQPYYIQLGFMLDRVKTLAPQHPEWKTKEPFRSILDGDLKGWLAQLAEIRASGVRQAVPGHGPALVPWAAAEDAQRRYLTALLDETRAAIAKGIPIEEAATTVAQSERDKWQLFDSYHGRNVLEAYRRLEWE